MSAKGEPPRDRDADADPEGDALEAEIAADRRLTKEGRRRWVLYLPPLASLAVAAAAIGLSHPRTVIGARVIAGARPPAGEPLRVRALIVQAMPGDERGEKPLQLEVRPAGADVHGSTTTADEDGVAELSIDAPVPASIDVEGRTEQGFVRLATLQLDRLPAASPTSGVSDALRTFGHATGDFAVDVAPERSALAPPAPGAAWVRVMGKSGADAGKPIEGATVVMTPETGVDGLPAPATTDAAGLARIALQPTAAPIQVSVVATGRAGDARAGAWTGVLGAVSGVPVPQGRGVVVAKAGGIDLDATTSGRHAYFDLIRGSDGVRVAGGAIELVDGHARVSLPAGSKGLYDLELSTGATPASSDDLAHFMAWPLVVADDAFDAWTELATSARITRKISTTPGAPSTYESATSAMLAHAPVVIPARAMVADGVPAAVAGELARSKRVRRAATFAILGGGLIELGLMILLGVFTAKRSVDDELAELAGQARPRAQATTGHTARVAAYVVTGVGIVALMFAGLALMAWGIPG